MNLNDYAAAFVKAYYTNVLTSPHDVKKFYSNDATYFRSYMNSNSSISVEPEKVCPHISSNSTLKIQNFVSAPIPKSSSISVSVFGSVQTTKKVFCFSQYFILQEIGERICIVSDIYNEFNETDLKQVNQPPEQASQQAANASPAQQNNANTNTNANNNTNSNTNNNNNNQNQSQSRQGKNRNRNKNKSNPFVYKPD